MSSVPSPVRASNRNTEPEGSAAPVISGRITVDGSELGVPGLVVEAAVVRNGNVVERLGAVVTDERGDFLLSQAPAAPSFWSIFQSRARDVELIVLAPERPGAGYESRILFRSEARRSTSGREQFRIALAAEQLREAGVATPVSAAKRASAKSIADALKLAREDSTKIGDAVGETVAANLQTVTARRTLFRSEIRPQLLKELSNVSAKEQASPYFVANDADVQTACLSAAKGSVESLTKKRTDASGGGVNDFRIRTRISLTDAQRLALVGDAESPVTLSERALEEMLQVTLDKPATIDRRHPDPDPCRPLMPAERCLSDDSSGGEPAPGDGDAENGTAAGDDQPGMITGAGTSGNWAGANVSFDRQTAIARLMDDHAELCGVPNQANGGSPVQPPLTAGGVSDVINGLVLRPGPADVPAFHDFHDLQIAFEPVWQEALDDSFLSDVEAAYEHIVERGGGTAGGISVVHRPPEAGRSNELFEPLLEALSDVGSASDDEVPATVVSVVLISLEQWRALPSKLRNHLEQLTISIQAIRDALIAALGSDDESSAEAAIALRSQIELHKADAERIVAHAELLLLERAVQEPFKPTHSVIEQLRRRREQAYPFRYFAATPRHRSVNFGIRVTYRQRWTPVSYQVGELVSTIPLAPGEVRKFTKKTVVKTKRFRKEVESNLASRKSEAEEKSRAESEIVARATLTTNFSLSKDGTISVGSGVSSSFTRDATTHSESVKKQLREAVRKSAEEYKTERKIEIGTEESLDVETTESGELRNPNDEIPVTFLLYELQRRYRVSEKIHRVQSVVLVAQEMPRPSTIDKAWAIRHDWILNRVLLDDSFRPALSYISTTLVSEEVVLKEMRLALLRQRTLVETLKEDVSDRRALAGLRYGALAREIERSAQSAGGSLLGDLVGAIPIAGSLLEQGVDALLGGEGVSEEAQIREGAARDAFDRERREEQEVAARLQAALSTLETMQRKYTERLAGHLNQLAQCERLLGHIKQNIMHYMQAVWAHESEDHRWLRLRQVPVPVFRKNKSVRRYEVSPRATQTFTELPRPSAREYQVYTDLAVDALPADIEQIDTRPLEEVADIHQLLGFQGNYMVFPMREANPITDFMMDPYVTLAEGTYGLSDPDPLGNMTLDEFSDYVCCLKEHFDRQAGGDSADDVASGANDFEKLKPALRETLKRLLQLSLRENEEIVVPCDCLYIEALPGAHSVMESFKLLHRQLDVSQAQSNLRKSELENIRRAQKILEGELEDPDVEAKYVFEGDGATAIVAPGGANPRVGGESEA